MRLAGVWLWILSMFALASPAAAAGVADLVAQVSQANLVAHISALQGDRATAAGKAAARAYITQELESYGYTVSTQPVGGSENLAAIVVGLSNPGDEFVLGAHFDAVSGSPGADDNASGVAAVLEAARILAGQPLDRTVHFAFFALEESGYQGSEAYAGALANAGANVVGMISVEMIGYTCSTPGCQTVLSDIPGCLESSFASDVGDFIGAAANTASTPLLNAFLANAAAYESSLPIESATVAGTGTCFPEIRRSDHKSFWDEGYPAMILADGAEARNPNYHMASDTLATLDLAFMTSVTRAIVGHVASTAMLSPSVPVLSPFGMVALATALLGAGGLGLGRRRQATRSDVRAGVTRRRNRRHGLTLRKQ